MKKVIATERIPIKIWTDDIDDGALEQAKNLANLPFSFKHIAIMPDVHLGYGMPIGGVIATEGVVIPNAVGVDIGCGMIFLNTGVKDMTQEQLKNIVSYIRKHVPVGFEKHKEKIPCYEMPEEDNKKYGDKHTITGREHQNAERSLGTLGGGNHFIEIQRDEYGYICIMIHSGSRNLGKQVADHFNKVAIAMNTEYYSSVPKSQQLAFLPLSSDEGKEYMYEMQYCVDFAKANRVAMMYQVLNAFKISGVGIYARYVQDVAHNYAAIENHYGKNVVVHRKGATLAKKGEIGIIPGSQGSCSYIVEGLGNPLSFNSCSHGAGRNLGRNQARRELNLSTEIERLDKLGVMHSIRGEKDLDEAPGAYKDIAVVMENQKDLVKIIKKLTPIAVIKG